MERIEILRNCDNVWRNKRDNIQKAINHINYMNQNYSKETELSVYKTKEYSIEDIDLNRIKDHVIYDNTEISIIDIDSVGAIFQIPSNEKIAVLNFASFKHPGGMFKNGSIAQEESLCHESNLYNILSKFEDSFYKDNLKRLNCSLYTDNMLYTKDVLFIRDGKIRNCDVITCAAPNRKTAVKYKGMSDIACKRALFTRLFSLMFTAVDNRVDTIILGAFGCGVFGNDPVDVSTQFNHIITSSFGKYFKRIIFAIPKTSNGNYSTFIKNINQTI